MLIQRRHELGRVAQITHWCWNLVWEVEENCRSWRMDEQVEARWCHSKLAEEHQPVVGQQDDGSLEGQDFDLKAKGKGRREGCSVGLLNEESMLSRQLRAGGHEGRLVQQPPFGLGSASAMEAALASFGNRSK